MFSKQAASKKIGAREGFRWRGVEISRIEGLSDAVFAFALALLIVSTEVPKTYDDLAQKLRDFVPFAACFVQIMAVWYLHYQFYRRYNLQDMRSTVLTMILLFVVLFYTYPLKFVYVAWWLSMIAPNEAAKMITSYDQARQLFSIYAIGYIAVFCVFGLMYLHAYRSRVLLQLTELEIWDTKHVLREVMLFSGVGVIALTLANVLPDEWVYVSGASYSLIGVVSGIHGGWSGRRRMEVHARLFSTAKSI
ncbi:MAG TPA: TMEM175 family protein [Candidatus Kapabacteria bacterium]|nr:TMEM175 family protein [Candidatus Kapabacteria bacterium]